MEDVTRTAHCEATGAGVYVSQAGEVWINEFAGNGEGNIRIYYEVGGEKFEDNVRIVIQKDASVGDGNENPNPNNSHSFSFTDAEDSNLPSFIDILKGSLQINGEQVVLELDVKELPEQLKFRQDSVNKDTLEYGWRVDITDRDSLFTFATFSFKFENGEVFAPIDSYYTQTDVWKNQNRLSQATLEIVGNKIRIIADTLEELNLDTINSIKVSTDYNQGPYMTFFDAVILK